MKGETVTRLVSSSKIVQLLADIGSVNTEQLLLELATRYSLVASATEIAPIIAKLEHEGFIVCVAGQWQLRLTDPAIK